MVKLLMGRYELVEKIGEGGMAVVYKAKDRLLNRYVAIKILRPEYTRDAQFVDSFRRESQAAAGLEHPNIISIYDVPAHVSLPSASITGFSKNSSSLLYASPSDNTHLLHMTL